MKASQSPAEPRQLPKVSVAPTCLTETRHYEPTAAHHEHQLGPLPAYLNEFKTYSHAS